jgi:hypothetical protein
MGDPIRNYSSGSKGVSGAKIAITFESLAEADFSAAAVAAMLFFLRMLRKMEQRHLQGSGLICRKNLTF